MAAIVSTRILALQAISPRQGTAPVIEKLAVPTIDGTGLQGGQTDYDTGVGFFLGRSGGAYKLSIGDPAGNKMTWTAAGGLNVSGTVTATAGSIGGWTINSDYLAKDTGVASTSAGMAPLDYPFYAGSTYANRATAPFRVTPTGDAYIGIGTFAGDISTSGYVNATGIASGAGYSAAIAGRPSNDDVDGIYGRGSGTGRGVHGQSVGSGAAISGTASGTGVGVAGAAFGTSSAGFAGSFQGTDYATALYVQSGTGQYALNLAGTGTAIMAGLLTCSALTASLPVIANASKQIVSATQTGTGTTFAMQTSPAFATDISTPAIKTASGALTITPAAGSGLDVVLSTTGDFKVNTNQLVVDTSAGAITSATQPAFLAFNSATDSDVTGNGASVTVDCDTEIFDQGGNFAADTFTASVTGRHRFSANVRSLGLSAATSIYLALTTSNRTYLLFYHAGSAIGGSGDVSVGGSTLADMDAGDTATLTYVVNGIGANTADIYGAAAPNTFFSGELIC